MKTPLSVVLVVFGLGAFPLHEARADITAISSSLSLHAEANAGIGLVENGQSMSQTFSLNPLSASTSAQAFNGNLSAATESDALVTWTSAGAGALSIHDRFTTDSPGWLYTFSSDLPATLTINYGISFAGPYAYSSILVLNQTTDSGLGTQFEFPKPPSNGTLSLAINPNIAYTLQIFDDANLNQNLPQFTSDLNATFSFQITPVPEPSGLALAVLGMTALRILSRRSRHGTS